MGHINAPYGSLVDEARLATYLRGEAQDDATQAVLSEIFIELSPSLLARCAFDLGLTLVDLNLLYERGLAQGARRSLAWEAAMQEAVS